MTDEDTIRRVWEEGKMYGSKGMGLNLLETLDKYKSQFEEPNRELWDVAIKGDSTVYSHIKTWQSLDDMSYTEMLEKLAIALAKEKKHYFDAALELTNKSLPRPVLIIDKHNTSKE